MNHDFILLDRSGSMSLQWDEALSSINAYVEKLAEDKVDTGVTLAAFDTGPNGALAFEIIRDRIIPSTWHKVTDKDCNPRGTTPLNDATGRIVDLANAVKYDKVAIIIMTDGHENASRELTTQQAKDKLEECRKKGWQVIFLGANFDNAVQAASYGNAVAQSVSSTSVNLRATMTATAAKRGLWGSGASASMGYTDEEKKKFSS